MRIDSAVIIVLRKRAEDYYVLFLKKSKKNLWHAGEVCFPGGTVDANEKPLDTALREFEEEVGVSFSLLKVIYELDPVETVSTPFIIYPFVAVALEDFVPKVDGEEIEKFFWVPLSEIKKHYPFKLVEYHYCGRTYLTYLIPWQGEIIWGATARILANFMDALSKIPLDNH